MINQVSYSTWMKEFCYWCNRGDIKVGDIHYVSPGETKVCTCPNAEQYVELLEAAIKLASKCIIQDCNCLKRNSHGHDIDCAKSVFLNASVVRSLKCKE